VRGCKPLGVRHHFRTGEKANRVLEAVTTAWHLCGMKIIIEKHSDGYVGYPAGVQGVVVGQGQTFEDALRDVQSAIRFHIETFGREALESESPALDAFVAEATL
jgi:predicted RNase H-like HicB family nuclease